ncbi:MAG: cation:proton antiporter [Cyanobium sp.]
MAARVCLALLVLLGSGAALAGSLHGAGPQAGSGVSSLSLPLLTVLVGGLFLGTLAIRRFSLSVGVPAILGVLLLGLSINLHTTLLSPEAISRLHTLSLAMLTFYSGVNTELRSIRGFLEYGVILAVGGVVVSSAVLGLIVWSVASPTAGGIELGFHQIPLGMAMLIAACLGSTDAGATISVLESLPRRIPERLQSLLEFEASLNDPTAILVLALVVGLFASDSRLGGGAAGGSERLLVIELRHFLQQVGSGLLVGVVMGYVARFSLERLVDREEELLILGLGVGLLTYGSAELLEGSGLIATYAAGVLMGNHRYRNAQVTPVALLQTLQPFNAMTEIVIFLIFGLAMHPRDLLKSLPEGAVIALGLMLIARPLSVLLFQRFSPFGLRESLLISWCGLRGAVPLALSFSVIEAVPHIQGVRAELVPALQNNAQVIVFCVVVLNLLIQGLTLPKLSQLLGIGAEPPAAPEPQA